MDISAKLQIKPGQTLAAGSWAPTSTGTSWPG
jgi:hypothetical protein